MGYARYQLADGRWAGYDVDDVCNRDDCDAEIDRGLGYLCGQEPGADEHGCGGYFCEKHLFMGGPSQLCEPCTADVASCLLRRPVYYGEWQVLDE